MKEEFLVEDDSTGGRTKEGDTGLWVPMVVGEVGEALEGRRNFSEDTGNVGDFEEPGRMSAFNCGLFNSGD